MNLTKKNGLFYGIIFGVTFLFVLLGEGEIGYVMGGDTEAYYLNFHHHIGVAPGYPLFIHLIEIFFGERFYLHIVAFLQILFLAASVTFLVFTVQTLLKLVAWEAVIVWGFSMLPFVMLLPEDPIGHVLMTESLTYPLFYVFMAVVFRAIASKRERDFVWPALLAMLMTWIRPQMLFAFAVVGIAYFYIQLVKRMREGKQPWKNRWYFRTAICFAIVLLLIKAVSGLTAVYEKVFFDAPALDYSDQTLVQRLLFLSAEEDAELFEGREKEIFEETWERMQEAGTTDKYFDKNWKSWSEIFKAFGANSRILGDVIRNQLAEEEILAKDTIGEEIQVAEISHELTMKLLKKHWPQHLELTAQLLPKSFISTAFFHKVRIYDLLLLATILVYLYCLIGSVLFFKRGEKSRMAAEWMLLVLLTSCINAVACDLILCGLQRYMAYTLGMTWIGVFLISREIFSIWRRGRKIWK